MDSTDKSVCIIVCALLMTITIVASVGCVTEYLKAESAIKAGLVQGQYGRWVLPNTAEDNK